MGRTFFERTMPRLVGELGRIADALERLADRLDGPRPDGLNAAAGEGGHRPDGGVGEQGR